MKLENTNLEDEISKDGITIVDYYADWCAPCNMLSPVLDMIEKSGTKVVKVDTEKFTELAKGNNIASLPTLIFYKDGEVAKRVEGIIPKPAIENLIETL